MASEIKEVLMRRDGMSSDEADEFMEDMKAQVQNGADPEEVLAEIGLEPDYIWELFD